MHKWLKNYSSRFLNATVVPFMRYTLSSALAESRIRAMQADLRKEIDDLRRCMSAITPDCPCLHGFKVFAQTDEDGILQNIFGRIPDHEKTFIEIGSGDGVENNTHYLALQGYKGCWVDGCAESIASVNEALGGLRFESLLVQQQFVSKDNIESILDLFIEFIGSREIGLFSLDIDGNDLYIMAEALKYINPQVICAEYNAKFPPPMSNSIQYNKHFCWPGDDYQGASLQAFCDCQCISTSFGGIYSGANALFFARIFKNNLPFICLLSCTCRFG